MARRNGNPIHTRVAEPRRRPEGEPVRARCLVCDRPLPLGLQRHYCLEHSAYPQQLVRLIHQHPSETAA